ncbi:chaperonin Hsp20 [Candidatus Mancarchaeum acidiphilum]|uniref:Chaperonin Hsp20 n=1 Tax=Candidatus Mancarchaeum acidiphilum TaxID=1920749 RepID=A0A218NM22_9ARCH|nr:Hsp20/alpha crystallin family protein [Candidatus Mancarchaeum acidiphilum]ASI13514.1 chaperonin Hsp20 [Candidatus Mancarchaeum acidiphilum]
MENKKEENRVKLYDPFDVFSGMDRFMRSALWSLHPERYFDIAENGFNIPDADIIDKGDSLQIKLDMPGVDKKNLDLKVKSDRIIVKAEKSENKEIEKKNYYSKERASIGYYREISLPEEVKSETAKAKYENGTLTINVDKSDRAKENSIKIE